MKKRKERMIRIFSFSLTSELYDKIEKYAWEQHFPMSVAVREILKEFFAKLEREKGEKQ